MVIYKSMRLLTPLALGIILIFVSFLHQDLALLFECHLLYRVIPIHPSERVFISLTFNLRMILLKADITRLYQL